MDDFFLLLQYTHDGLRELPNRLRLATDDTSQYLDNTGREINTLLVTNYAELEEVLGEILDESGPILKRTLAQVTQAVAIDNLVQFSLFEVLSQQIDLRTAHYYSFIVQFVN